MRVHKNRLFNVVISIIMVVAMVATLCTTFEAESETVSAATAFEKSISEFRIAISRTFVHYIANIQSGNLYLIIQE